MSNPAAGYEGYMVPALFGPWAAKLVQVADPRPDERVLDVGCGTGIVARQVASRLGARGHVTGIDLNSNMLAVARESAARERATVDWRQGRAEHLPFPDHHFDLVLCQFALMFFADKPTALAEMHRVLTRNGRALLSVWQSLDRHPFYATLHDVLQQHTGVSALRDIFALGVADLRALLLDAGFAHVDVEPLSMTARFPNPDGFLAGEIEVDTAAIPSMQHLDADARRDIVSAITADMKDALAAVTHEDHVAMDFHARIGRAWS